MNVAALILLIAIAVSVLGIVLYEQFRGSCSILKQGESATNDSMIDPKVLRRMKRIDGWGTLATVVVLTVMLGLALRAGAFAACVPADARFVITNGWPLSFFVSFFFSISVCWLPTSEILRLRFPGQMEGYVQARFVEYQNRRYSSRYAGFARALYGKIAPMSMLFVAAGAMVAIFGLKASNDFLVVRSDEIIAYSPFTLRPSVHAMRDIVALEFAQYHRSRRGTVRSPEIKIQFRDGTSWQSDEMFPSKDEYRPMIEFLHERTGIPITESKLLAR